jgi:hypothetical protein
MSFPEEIKDVEDETIMKTSRLDITSKKVKKSMIDSTISLSKSSLTDKLNNFNL